MGVDTATSILDMDGERALQFFLKSSSYSSIDLPPYFNFSPLINKIYSYLKYKNLDTLALRKARDTSKANYIVLQNKDNKFGWRKLQLINPVLYTALAIKLTYNDNWKILKDTFLRFSSESSIICTSIPIESNNDEKDTAQMISKWWTDFEQRSISLSLDYSYIFKTDIANCYDSIYTHAISWALHTKEVAKENRKSNNLGNNIDCMIQEMQHGQTNGIPQGSVLMDFIAEIILGYLDLELSKEINKDTTIGPHSILRYRDDYRIFTNNPVDGEKILKNLSIKASEVGFKLNTTKTSFSTDVISNSIKREKISWITSQQFNRDIPKQLIVIREYLIHFPNAGTAKRELANLYKRIYKKKKITPEPLIAIVTDIAFNNHGMHSICAAIISVLLAFIEKSEDKIKFIHKIHNKFLQRPYSGHMLIWLQRISYLFDANIEYNEPLCRHVTGTSEESVWDFSWVETKALKQIVTSPQIIDKNQLSNIKEKIQIKEFELFIDKDPPS